MNPAVARHGRSFKGAWQYYLHDAGRDSRNRIAWTETLNMMTEDPDKAWKVMAYTAKVQDRLKEAAGLSRAGRKSEKPVMAYALSWHPGQTPDKDHMAQMAMKSLEILGLEEHEAILVAHTDTPHRHVHVIVNRIHPLTGKVATDSHSYKKLSAFAYEYQKEHGLEHQTPKRKEKQEALETEREQGRDRQSETRSDENAKKTGRYVDPKITAAWEASETGEAFKSALEDQGYRLAQGRKRIVIIDPYGKAHNPTRQLDGVKAKDFKNRITDLDTNALPEATALAREITQRHNAKKRQNVQERDQDQDREQKAQQQKEVHGRDSAEPPTSPDQSKEDNLKDSFNRKEKQLCQRSEKPANGSDEQEFGEPTEPEVLSKTERDEPPKRCDDEWANRLRAKTQNRHHTENADLSDRLSRAINLKRDRLRGFYKLDRQTDAIAQLTECTTKPSFWSRLTGRHRRECRKLQSLEANYSSARGRFDEAMEAQENKRRVALQDLAKRHRRERALEERRIQAKLEKEGSMRTPENHSSRETRPRAGPGERDFGL
jgi:hypothetical protein